MTSSTVLAVPIRVDAFFAAKGQAVVSAETDFSRLPFSTPTGDINPESAWLGERIAYQPFDDDRLQLKAGVHLHWQLPEALRTGTTRGQVLNFPFDNTVVESLRRGKLPGNLPKPLQDAGISDETEVVEERNADGTADRWRILGLQNGGSATIRVGLIAGVQQLRVHLYEANLGFPLVPNRWLVRRTGYGEARFWLVESDYLHDTEPPQDPKRLSPIQFPVLPPFPPGGPGASRPYQWLGRVHDFAEGLPDELPPTPGASRKSIGLTAIGYGTLSFAAFYPNCYSVFGFHDPDITSPPDGKLEYHVVGWHGHQGHDALRSPPFMAALEHVKERYKGIDPTPDSPSARAFQAEALRTAYGWIADGFPEPPKLDLQHPPPDRTFPSRSFLVGGVRPGNDAPPRALKCTVAIGHTGTEALSAYAAATLGRPELEDQLEGLHLWPKLEGVRIDVGPKFGEARHEKEFSPFDAGRRWVFAQGDAEPGKPGLGLPRSDILSRLEKLNPLLKKLNKAEAEFDQKAAELSARRRQLYAEWCKYLICAYPPLGEQDHYPDMDTVREFIERHSLVAAERARMGRRSAREAREAALRDLRDALAAEAGRQSGVELKVRQPPRFWAPKEPAILLAGSAIPVPHRPNPAEALTCTVHDIGGFGGFGAIKRDQAIKLADLAAAHPLAVAADQWHPIFLDWQVHLKPLFEGSNLPADVTDFRPDFVTSNFEFDPNSADLRFRKEASLPTKNAPRTRYSGRSIVTPHIGRYLRNEIEAWLRRVLSIDATQTDLVTAARAKLGQSRNGVAENILAAYAHLFVGDAGQPAPHFIAQALTGFNPALLMQRSTLQLPIADPLGFPEDRAFAERVAIAIGNDKRGSPMPLTEFHPIRAGLLEIEARSPALFPDHQGAAGRVVGTAGYRAYCRKNLH